ncbi:MAG: EscU/YscU/HrcU family type III secretion system export apparatus switch protein [Planctomycetota bacterium]
MSDAPRQDEDRPRPLAVALRYAPAAVAAPVVTAKGRGEVAHRILELADRHQIPVRRDEDLLQLLALCDVGEEIPADLYGAVAALLAYLWRLNGELRGAERGGTGPG